MIRHNTSVGLWCAAVAVALALWAGLFAVAGARADALQAMIEADWAAQEVRLQRTAGSPESIREALRRAGLLLDDLRGRAGAPDLAIESAALKPLIAMARHVDDLGADACLRLYRQIRQLTRAAALKNPLLADRPLVFMKRKRFACQMLHEYIAYFNQYSGQFGGGVFVLEEPGHSLKTRDLTAGRLPPGCYTSLAVSNNARTVYFAFAEWTGKKPAFGSADQRYYHIYALDLAGGHPRPLTDGPYDDTDPCPLPDGGMAFISTRRGGYTRCNNPWEPIAVYTLHRMDADGKNVRALSFHETNEWHPSVLHDGRIAYCRWDYVDRSAANYHGLWASNPDGSNPAALFGNYTSRISACFQPYAIPGSQRILFVAGRITRMSAAAWFCSIRRVRPSTGRPATTVSTLSKCSRPKSAFPRATRPTEAGRKVIFMPRDRSRRAISSSVSVTVRFPAWAAAAIATRRGSTTSIASATWNFCTATKPCRVLIQSSWRRGRLPRSWRAREMPPWATRGSWC